MSQAIATETESKEDGLVFELTAKQSIALDRLEDDVTEQVLFGGGAGGGKSALGCYWVVKGCIKYPGSRWVIGRAVRRNLYKTTVKTLREIIAMLGLINGHHYRENSQDSALYWANGSEILFEDLSYISTDANFDRLGSLELTGAFVDEAAEIVAKCRDVLKSRIRYKLEGIDSDGKPYELTQKLLMTCNPSKGWIYNDFYKPSKDNTLRPDFAFIQSLVHDNRHISKAYIKGLETIADIATKQRLLYGNWDFDDTEGILIPYNKAVDLFHNSFVPYGEERYITADIALQGSDKFVIMVWAGFVVIALKVVPKANAKEVENELRHLEYMYAVPRSNICYDSDGVGGFLDAYLEDSIAFVNNAQPIYKTIRSEREQYYNLKSQCFFHAARAVNRGEVWIEAEVGQYKDEITEELSTAKNASIGTDDKLRIQKKKDWKELLGRSPDFADCFAMRWYFEVGFENRGVTML